MTPIRSKSHSFHFIFVFTNSSLFSIFHFLGAFVIVVVCISLHPSFRSHLIYVVLSFDIPLPPSVLNESAILVPVLVLFLTSPHSHDFLPLVAHYSHGFLSSDGYITITVSSRHTCMYIINKLTFPLHNHIHDKSTNHITVTHDGCYFYYCHTHMPLPFFLSPNSSPSITLCVLDLVLARGLLVFPLY